MTSQADYNAMIPAILALLECGNRDHAEELAQRIGMTVDEALAKRARDSEIALDSLSQKA